MKDECPECRAKRMVWMLAAFAAGWLLKSWLKRF